MSEGQLTRGVERTGAWTPPRAASAAGGERMAILHTRFYMRRYWLILAMVGLAVVVGLLVYGSRPTALPTPEQLCRERLGLRQQTTDSVAGASMLSACIKDVTHSRRNPPTTPGR
jgi:hypothetical protein